MYQASGDTNNKSGGGVSNQNGKGRVALKKISVQFWQNLFPYQNVLVLKKFLQKFLEKQKGGLYLLVEFLEGRSEKYRGKHFGCCIYWSDLLGKWFGLG